MNRNLGAWMCGVAILVGAPAAVQAQAPEPEPSELPEGYRADPEGARAVLDECLAKYRGAQSLRFEVLTAREELTWFKGEAQPKRKAVGSKPEEISVIFRKPSDWVIRGSSYIQYHADAQTIDFWPTAGQFRAWTSPDQLNPSMTGSERYRSCEVAPQRLFYFPAAKDAFVSGFEPIGLKEAPYKGAPAVWIFGSAPHCFLQDEVQEVTLVIDATTHSLLSIRRDWTPLSLRLFEQDRRENPERAYWFGQCAESNDIVTEFDALIDPAEFVFDPDSFDPPPIRVTHLVYAGEDLPHELAEAELIDHPPFEFEAKSFENKPFKLSDLRGRVVVLDFWASWCGPCLQDMPSLQRLSEFVADLPVTVVGVDIDTTEEGRAKAQEYAKQMGITYTLIFDPDNRINDLFKVHSYPSAVFLDRQGRVWSQGLYNFAHWSREDWRQQLEFMLHAPPIPADAPSRLEQVRAVAAARRSAEPAQNQSE